MTTKSANTLISLNAILNMRSFPVSFNNSNAFHVTQTPPKNNRTLITGI